MQFFRLNGNQKTNIPIFKYLVDWDTKKVSKPQYNTKQFLKPFWESCTVLEEFRIPGSKLRVDLLNITNSVVLEISPASSHDFNKFFHKTREGGFLSSLKRDESKRIWAEKSGFTYIELGDAELKNLTKEMFAGLGLEL